MFVFSYRSQTFLFHARVTNGTFGWGTRRRGLRSTWGTSSSVKSVDLSLKRRSPPAARALGLRPVPAGASAICLVISTLGGLRGRRRPITSLGAWFRRRGSRARTGRHDGLGIAADWYGVLSPRRPGDRSAVPSVYCAARAGPSPAPSTAAPGFGAYRLLCRRPNDRTQAMQTPPEPRPCRRDREY
jgi:hypothetical protein